MGGHEVMRRRDCGKRYVCFGLLRSDDKKVLACPIAATRIYPGGYREPLQNLGRKMSSDLNVRSPMASIAWMY